MNPADIDRVRSTTEARGRPVGRMSPALLQRRLRDIHLYLGMLFAPSLLFFAATGALQLFDLHENRPNRSFEPPALLQELGMVHKKQVFALPHRRNPSPESPQAGNAPDAGQAAPDFLNQAATQTRERSEGWQVLALKIFFLLAAIGLFASTCLGVWIGLRPGRNRAAAIGLLAAGVVVPALLLLA